MYDRSRPRILQAASSWKPSIPFRVYEDTPTTESRDADMLEASQVLARLLYAISQRIFHGLKEHCHISPSPNAYHHVTNRQLVESPSPVIRIPALQCMGPSLHSVQPLSAFTPSTNIFSVAVHPDLEFLVVINPNSGPGAAPWWPNEDYIREIPRLNALPNVTTLGYVRATYCKRDLKDVLEDIETYAERGRIHKGLRVNGIFVDETVNLYSKEAKAYLDAIDRKVEDSIGVDGSRLASDPSRFYDRYVMLACADSGSGDPQPRHRRAQRARKPRTRYHSRCRSLVCAVHDKPLPALASHFAVRPLTVCLHGPLSFGRRGRVPDEGFEGTSSVSVRNECNV
jgi:hypothetical protein